MIQRPDVPQFGALLRPHIASVPAQGRPAFLAGLERSAAQRYRRWAEALPDHSAKLLECAEREDEIATLVSNLFPVSPDVQSTIDASLPAAIKLYYDVFDSHTVGDQLYLQAEAELQGAQAWVAMAAEATAEASEILKRCTALEEQSSVVVKQLLEEFAL